MFTRVLAASSVRNAAAVWARGLWVGNGARVNAGGAAYPTVAASYGRRNLHSTRYVCAEADNSPIRRRQADAADEDTNVANYMTGFEHAINEDGDDAMQKMYSLDHASNRQLVKAKIAQAIIEFQEKPGDTGSTQVQVAVLHTKIVSLSEHCNANRQDKHSRRGLEIMMEKRRKLLQYLKRKNFAKYNDVIKRLKLRPVAGIR